MQANVQAKLIVDHRWELSKAPQLWQVVAMYTQALHQAIDQDGLSVCRTFARVGQMFTKHPKLQQQAVDCCKAAVQVAHTLKPVPNNHDWFQVCTHANFGSRPRLQRSRS